ncbi:MAG: hypothetical protein E6I05_02345 [Chloroflexi bacterium]|nr:MAG: hypothetical protein E6I05_02345 [Chloroflexota bacterium]
MPIWGPEPTWPPASPVWPGSRREGELTEGMRLFGAVDRMLQAEQRLLAPVDEQVRRDELAAIAPASGLPGL